MFTSRRTLSYLVRNYGPLFGVTQSNVDLRNITSDCYLNIVVSLDCY